MQFPQTMIFLLPPIKSKIWSIVVLVIFAMFIH
ncbi:hypothetical protein IOK_13768 [Yersinia enterocolitica subsp. palearctica PhRBD_Ye1]|nr:hypothetical protein IOK_13768 [Yersinia enterocolitica subsp. palearctica PhRBD_Ye1]